MLERRCCVARDNGARRGCSNEGERGSRRCRRRRRGGGGKGEGGELGGGRWVKGSGPEPHFIFMQLLISVEPDTRRVPSLPLPASPSSLLLALPRPPSSALRPTRPPATAPLAALCRRATLCPFRGKVAAGN